MLTSTDRSFAVHHGALLLQGLLTIISCCYKRGRHTMLSADFQLPLLADRPAGAKTWQHGANKVSQRRKAAFSSPPPQAVSPAQLLEALKRAEPSVMRSAGSSNAPQ